MAEELAIQGGTGPRSDELAFAALARDQLGRLYAAARRLVGDQAEDLVQDCLLRAYSSFGELRDRAAAPRWFDTILLNCARDRYRRAERRVREDPVDPTDDFSLYRTIADEDPFPYSDSLHVDFLHRFGREDVWEVLASLPDIYRVPLVLVHMEGRPTAEVAAILDVPLGTVLARLHRGRKRFERTLWEYARSNDLLRTEVPT